MRLPSVNSSKASYCDGKRAQPFGKTQLTRNKLLEVDEEDDIVGSDEAEEKACHRNLLLFSDSLESEALAA
jgi:hypothetical protein